MAEDFVIRIPELGKHCRMGCDLFDPPIMQESHLVFNRPMLFGVVVFFLVVISFDGDIYVDCM